MILLNLLLIILSIAKVSANEEVWLNASSLHQLKKYTLITEILYRNRFSDNEKTNALRLNTIAGPYLAGIAYYDFPMSQNERRVYLGRYSNWKKLNFRNLIENRSFNNGDNPFRFRSKLDYEWLLNTFITSELLYQINSKDFFEMRLGILFRKPYEGHLISLIPTVISSQYQKNRYLVVIGVAF
jgi:hypothetical protein